MYFEIESQVFPLNITEEISYFDPFHVTGQRFSDVFMGVGGGGGGGGIERDQWH